MTTSSAQSICSITLTKEQLDELSKSTISFTSGGSGYYTSATVPAFTYTTSTTTASSFCINPPDFGNISVWSNTEWVDSFPSWARVEKMCKEYPGLKVAFEKFKNTYNLVKDDYDTPPEKRIKP